MKMFRVHVKVFLIYSQETFKTLRISYLEKRQQQFFFNIFHPRVLTTLSGSKIFQ